MSDRQLYERCHDCNGRGSISVMDGQGRETEYPCERCYHGNGYVPATIDRQTIANIIDDFVDRLDHDEAPDSQSFARLVNATADRVIAAVKGET